MTFGTYEAVTEAPHDGDTVRMTLDLPSSLDSPMLDLGFGILFRPEATMNLACRFYGIDAPELNTDAGKKARDALAVLLPARSNVVVDSYHWDKYGGRFDGVVWLPNGTQVNQWMVDNGYAKTLSHEPLPSEPMYRQYPSLRPRAFWPQR